MFSRQLIKNIVRFASGEALARLASIAVMMLLGHRYGVVVVGAYALAISLSGYSITLIDFGLRHIGARLIAQYAEHGDEIVRRVQRRRFLMAGIVVPLIVIYSLSIRFPRNMMWFVVIFSATSALYAASLDWVAWGKEHLQLVGGFRALIPIAILIAILASRTKGETVLWWAAAGNLIGYILQAVVFRLWWKGQAAHTGSDEEVPAKISDSLLWRATVVMGIAWVAQIAFNSIDTLMLGVVSGPVQVGLYSAAYRILTQVLITYYLVILSLYPSLARLNSDQRIAVLRPRILMLLFGAGAVIAVGISIFRRELLVLLFGSSFAPAASLVLVLAWAIPLDFMTSYLNNAYIAWGMERKLLNCILIAAGTNVVLNLIFLPKYGAMAAAVNTLIAYLVYLAGLVSIRHAARLGASTPAVLITEPK